jgi:hypothetical protein
MGFGALRRATRIADSQMAAFGSNSKWLEHAARIGNRVRCFSYLFSHLFLPENQLPPSRGQAFSA